MDIEQESGRIRLAEDTAAVHAKETQVKRDQDELSREKREFTQKQEKWNAEKEHIGKLGLEVEKRAQEIEELSLVSLIWRIGEFPVCARIIFKGTAGGLLTGFSQSKQ